MMVGGLPFSPRSTQLLPKAEVRGTLGRTRVGGSPDQLKVWSRWAGRPLPGPLPSVAAATGRGTSEVQIVISCRTVAETREAELGGGETEAGFSHTHTNTHSPYSHILTYIPQRHTHTAHTHTPDIDTRMCSHTAHFRTCNTASPFSLILVSATRPPASHAFSTFPSPRVLA